MAAIFRRGEAMCSSKKQRRSAALPLWLSAHRNNRNAAYRRTFVKPRASGPHSQEKKP